MSSGFTVLSFDLDIFLIVNNPAKNFPFLLFKKNRVIIFFFYSS